MVHKIASIYTLACSIWEHWYFASIGHKVFENIFEIDKKENGMFGDFEYLCDLSIGHLCFLFVKWLLMPFLCLSRGILALLICRSTLWIKKSTIFFHICRKHILPVVYVLVSILHFLLLLLMDFFFKPVVMYTGEYWFLYLCDLVSYWTIF